MGWDTVFHNAITSSLLSLLANKLTDLTQTEAGHVWNVDTNLSQLVTTSRTVRHKLKHLGEHELPPKEWRSWVEEVTELFYQVDDIIDDIVLDEMKENHKISSPQHQQQQQQDSQQMVEVQDQECTSNFIANAVRRVIQGKPRQGSVHDHPLPPSERRVRGAILSKLKKWGLPRRISSLLQKLKEIDKQLDGLVQVVDLTRPTTSTNNAFSSPQMGGSSGMGIPESSKDQDRPLARSREKVKRIIIEKLLINNPSSEGKDGVCIVGMSGLGKTALARAIEKDPKIEHHFDYVFWDKPFEQGHPAANGHSPPLHQEGRRILVILDDLWNVKHLAWSRYKATLGAKTVLLITTRDPQVASITSTTPYYIQKLSDKECHKLIMQMLPKRLSDRIGHSIPYIAKKCAGLPLVAIMYGLVIPVECRRRDPEEAISEFEERDLWDLKEFQDEFFPLLRFDNNPVMEPELGKFLAYMHLFPDEHPFRKDELSQHWMAEGFVAPEEWTAKGMRNAGQYFDLLLSRSLLYYSHSSLKDDENHTYEIHEFTNRFAKNIASNLCYRMNDSKNPFLPNTDHTRHLSLCCQNIEPHYFHLIQNSYRSLRTFLMLPQQTITNINQVPDLFFERLCLLRVVTLARSHITTLPRSIRNLKHLRYLDASNNAHLKTLPDTICELIGLRVLKLRNCRKLLYLPDKICKLVNLFHLDVDMTHLPSPPQHIGMLTNLQTLDTFIVKKKEGYHITELSNLNSLCGSLTIRKLENVVNPSEAENARLSQKRHLRKLELHWEDMPAPIIASNILESLQPNIERLSDIHLMNYNGAAFPIWLSSPSSHLKVLHLDNCPSIDNLPSFWRLPLLETFSIDTASSLVHLGRQFYGDINQKRFPKLRILKLKKMTMLTKLEELELGDFPSLRKLEFFECPALSYLPSLRFLNPLDSLVIKRCPKIRKIRDLQLLPVKSIDVDQGLVTRICMN